MASWVVYRVIVVTVVAASVLLAWSPAYAQEAETTGVEVVSLEVSPSDPAPSETITVTVSVRNNGTATVEHLLELMADNQVAASQTLSLGPGQIQSVSFSLIAPAEGEMLLAAGDVTEVVRVARPQTEGSSSGEMRVGPSVRLDVRQDKITTDQDAVIDLFWNNSALNDLDVMIEVSVDVPTGLYMYSQDGAMACAAGRCQAIFRAPPGSVRNMPIKVKADRKGDYFIHMNGRYWPENDRDNWNPVSLSTPIDVSAASRAPRDPGFGGGTGVTSGPDAGTTPWWLSPLALVAWALLAVVVVAVVAFGAISRTVRAAKTKPPKIDIS